MFHAFALPEDVTQGKKTNIFSIFAETQPTSNEQFV